MLRKWYFWNNGNTSAKCQCITSDGVELLTFCIKKAASACSLKDDLQACSVITIKGGEEI